MFDREDELGWLAAQLRAHGNAGLDPMAEARIEARLADRLASASSRRGRVRTWIAGHLMIVVATSAVSVGGAGAAAVVIQQQQGTPSHPTQGEIPRASGQTRKGDLRYDISMAPQAEVGSVGWCSSLTLRLGSRPFGGAGCGPAPLAERHIFSGGTTYLGKGGGLLAYSIVDDTVAYALTTDRLVERLLPVSDPALPNGWRAIVQLPGETHTGNLRYRDAAGQRIKTSVRGGQFAERRLPTSASEATVADDAPCSISLPPDADPRGARWLTALESTPRLAGRALLPCAQTRFRVDEAWVEATVFLDAAHPGVAEPMPMPSDAARGQDADIHLMGSRSPFGRAGQQRMPAGAFKWTGITTARRTGKAWLAIRTDDRALRRRLLDTVSISVKVP